MRELISNLVDQATNGSIFGVTTGSTVGVTTPLFQTNFFPDLMQVKVLLPAVDLMPTLVHFAPALVAECAGITGK